MIPFNGPLSPNPVLIRQNLNTSQTKQQKRRSDRCEIHALMRRSDKCEIHIRNDLTTGSPSSSREMIILHNNSHGGIIRVCMGIFTTALGNKKIRQILNRNTSPYFHSVPLVIWPPTLMKRTHFSELSISKFSTYIKKAQGWTLHFRTTDPRSEKSQRKMTGRPQIQRKIRAQTVVSFQLTTNSIFPVQPTLSRSLLQKCPVHRFQTARVHISLDTRPLKAGLVTLPPFLTEPRRGPHRNLALRNCLSTTGAKLRCGPRRGLVKKGGRVTALVFNGRVSRLMCTWAVRNLGLCW